MRRRCTHCRTTGPEHHGCLNARGQWFCSVSCLKGEQRHERGRERRELQLAWNDADNRAEAEDLVGQAADVMATFRAAAAPKPEPYVPAKRPVRIVFGNVPLLVAARMIVESGPGYVLAGGEG